jgi:hypothetical protein
MDPVWIIDEDPPMVSTENRVVPRAFLDERGGVRTCDPSRVKQFGCSGRSPENVGGAGDLRPLGAARYAEVGVTARGVTTASGAALARPATIWSVIAHAA